MATKVIQLTPRAIVKHKKTPIDDALCQAIFNGFDADATEVRVTAKTRVEELLPFADDADADVDEIIISDNGMGLPFDEIANTFVPYEQSWKSGIMRSGKPPYHGEEGCGRFKCFALGGVLIWKTVYRDKDNGQMLEYTMSLDVSNAKNLQHDNAPKPSKAKKTGTVLTIKKLTKKFVDKYKEKDAFCNDVLENLLLDIDVYQRKVWLFGKRLDPKAVRDQETTFPFSCNISDTLAIKGTVRVIAWKDNVQFVSHKHTFFYGANTRFVTKQPSGLPADTHFPAHTLIVSADGLEKISDLEGNLGPFAKIEKTIRPQVIKFLVEVKRSSFADVLNQLFANEQYPFKKPVQSPLEEAKVTAFNAVLGALVFDNAAVVAPQKKAVLKVIFPLLNRLMSGEALLGENVDRILELGDEHAQKFKSVFSRIKLSAILDRYNRLHRRYVFLETLNKLVHVEEYADLLRERTQLHKIVEQEPWIFGPEFEQQNLVTSDQSLVTLLRQQVKRQDLFFDTPPDRQKLQKIEEFIEAHKSDVKQCLTKIPDLVLAKRVKTSLAEDARQFLVIELKRPTVKIDKKCREQAQQVFTGILAGTKGGGLEIDSQHRWRYCLVSSDIAPELESEFGKNGHLEEKMGGDYVVDARKWSTIIAEARQRLDEEMKEIQVEVKDPDCQDLLREYEKLLGVKFGHGDPETPQSCSKTRRVKKRKK